MICSKCGKGLAICELCITCAGGVNQLQKENARLRYLIQRSTVKALGQAAYDNSPCPAHGLKLLDNLLDEMKNNYAIVQEEKAELKAQLIAVQKVVDDVIIFLSLSSHPNCRDAATMLQALKVAECQHKNTYWDYACSDDPPRCLDCGMALPVVTAGADKHPAATE